MRNLLPTKLFRLCLEIADRKQESVSAPLTMPIGDNGNLVRQVKQITRSPSDNYLTLLDRDEVRGGHYCWLRDKLEFAP